MSHLGGTDADKRNSSDDNTCGEQSGQPDSVLAHRLPNFSKTDHELARVIDAWPLLTADDRSAILAIADAASGRAAR